MGLSRESFARILGGLALLLGTINLQGQVYINNGSFENGFAGWNKNGFNTVLGPPWSPNNIATDGTHAAAIGTFDVPASSISQTVDTLVAGAYTIQFDWFPDAEGVPNMTGNLAVT